MEIPLPVVVTLGYMTGVLGAEMFLGPQSAFVHSTPIDRGVILLPDILIDRYDVDVPGYAPLRFSMRSGMPPATNGVSITYDNGKWTEGQ